MSLLGSDSFSKENYVSCLSAQGWRKSKRHVIERPKPTLADLGLNVTVCIASRCFHSESIIATQDARISLGDVTSANINVKNQPLIGRWRMMIAGNDISPAWLIHRRAYGKLRNQARSEKIEPRELSFDAVRRAVAESYQEELSQAKTDAVLGPYRLTLVDFIKGGRKKLGDVVFDELFHKLEEVRFELDLLVYGFEDKALGHIFTVKSPGVVQSDDLLGYSAIGSGFWIAMSFLMRQKLSQLTDREIIYRICEAKFAAEAATGVGRETSIAILDASGMESIIQSEHLEGIRQVWEQEGRPKVPTGALEAVDAAVLKGQLTDD